MNEEERNQILARAQKRRETQAQQAAAAPQQAQAQPAASRQPIVRATGDATIRIIDENNPPTPVRAPRGGTRVRQSGAPQQGSRVMGARVVSQDELQPGPRMRPQRPAGAYGATNVTQQGQPPPPMAHGALGNALRTPMAPQAPQGRPVPQQHGAPPAAPAPQPAPSPQLNTQIASLGRTMGVTGQAPAAPVAAAGAEMTQVWVIMSQHLRPQSLEKQYRALVASGLADEQMTCWVNPAGTKLNDGLLGRVPHVRASRDMGPWMRWMLVHGVQRKYTLVIDDDCTPGPAWLRIAVQRLEQAEASGDRLIVAAAGTVFSQDAVDQAEPVGPESLHRHEVDVDLGRGAWLMPTDLARQIANFPIVGSPLATAIHVAAAAQHHGASIVVLAYPHDNREGWGMLEAPTPVGSIANQIDRDAQQHQGRIPSSAALRGGDYEVYRDVGWEPLCVMAAAVPASDDSTPEETPEAS